MIWEVRIERAERSRVQQRVRNGGPPQEVNFNLVGDFSRVEGGEEGEMTFSYFWV